MVRILLRTLPKEYDQSVKAVQDLVRLRKASVEGQVGYITNLEDNVKKKYSSDWLPNNEELRVELIAAWRLMERRRKEDGKHQNKGAQQRNKGKRDGGKGDSKGKEPCHNWSRGNGFCKYADACRFSHDGPKGDQGKEPHAKRKGDAVYLATK